MKIKESANITPISNLHARDLIDRVHTIISKQTKIDFNAHKKIVMRIFDLQKDAALATDIKKELFDTLIQIRAYSRQLGIIETRTMKDLQLINTLCESRLFRTKETIGRYSAADKRDLFYAILVSGIAMAQDTQTTSWARSYFGQAAAFGNFDYFRTSGNDLYVLSYILQNDLMLMSAPQAQVLIRLYRSVSQGDINRSLIEQTLLRMERMLHIGNTRLRNARRVIVNWAGASEVERKTTITQLHRFIRSKAKLAEVLPYLNILTKGDAGHFGKMTPLKKAAAIAGAGLAGLALGLRYDPNKRWSVFKKESVEITVPSLNEDRATQLFQLVQGMKQHPEVEDVIAVNYLADGISAFVRTTDGNAYEMEIRPARYAKSHQALRGVNEGWDWSIIGEDVDNPDCDDCQDTGWATEKVYDDVVKVPCQYCDAERTTDRPEAI